MSSRLESTVMRSFTRVPRASVVSHRARRIGAFAVVAILEPRPPRAPTAPRPGPRNPVTRPKSTSQARPGATPPWDSIRRRRRLLRFPEE